jgi:hypothetical protein
MRFGIDRPAVSDTVILEALILGIYIYIGCAVIASAIRSKR